MLSTNEREEKHGSFPRNSGQEPLDIQEKWKKTVLDQKEPMQGVEFFKLSARNGMGRE